MEVHRAGRLCSRREDGHRNTFGPFLASMMMQLRSQCAKWMRVRLSFLKSMSLLRLPPTDACSSTTEPGITDDILYALKYGQFDSDD